MCSFAQKKQGEKARKDQERARQWEQQETKLEAQRQKELAAAKLRHERQAAEQVLRQEQIKKTWEKINTARIKSVEVEQKRRVVQEKKSVSRLHHQVLSIMLESWRVYTAVRRRLERQNVSSMIPSSMLAIEKQIARRRLEQETDEMLRTELAEIAGEEPPPSDESSSPPKTLTAAETKQKKRAAKTIDSGQFSPRDVGLINSAMQVFQGNGRQMLTRSFLVWQKWCQCLKSDVTASRSESKLLCLFRFYLAAARGVEFTSASASMTSHVAQFTTGKTDDGSGSGRASRDNNLARTHIESVESSQPAVSPGSRGNLASSQPPLMLVLEDDEDDEEEEEDEDVGDKLPELGSARGDVASLARNTPRGEQSAPPRLARGAGSQPILSPPHGSAPSPGQSMADWKLASYQLPSLALVRTAVPEISPGAPPGTIGLSMPVSCLCALVYYSDSVANAWRALYRSGTVARSPTRMFFPTAARSVSCQAPTDRLTEHLIYCRPAGTWGVGPAVRGGAPGGGRRQSRAGLNPMLEGGRTPRHSSIAAGDGLADAARATSLASFDSVGSGSSVGSMTPRSGRCDTQYFVPLGLILTSHCNTHPRCTWPDPDPTCFLLSFWGACSLF